MLVSHDLSGIVLICWFAQETGLIIINDENGVQLNHFLKPFDFSEMFYDLKVQKISLIWFWANTFIDYKSDFYYNFKIICFYLYSKQERTKLN